MACVPLTSEPVEWPVAGVLGDKCRPEYFGCSGLRQTGRLVEFVPPMTA